MKTIEIVCIYPRGSYQCEYTKDLKKALKWIEDHFNEFEAFEIREINEDVGETVDGEY